MKNKYLLLFIITILFLILEYYLFGKSYIEYVKHLILGQKDRSTTKLIFYFLSLILSFFFLPLMLFIKQRILFTIVLIINIFIYFTNLIYKDINGNGFSFNDLQIAFMESDKMSLNALLTFKDIIINAIIILIPIFLLLYFIKRYISKYKLFISNKFILPIILFSILSSFTIYYKTAGTSNVFSIPITTINNFLYYSVSKVYYAERKPLKIKPKNKPFANNIILIVDESVTGYYLSINGYNKNTTPYLNSIKNKFLNYGLISSGANGSAPSNMILMSGIQLKNLPDKKCISLKKSNIFQYSKNANYYTSYISGQTGGLQNYMTKFDTKYIDNFFKPNIGLFEVQKNPEEDIVTEIVKNIKKHKKNFMFIVKRGVHFHYENSYPQNQKYFTPTLEKDKPMKFTQRDKAVNSYLNGIRWKVDEFFKLLIKKTHLLDRNDTIIIYTSDHGQSILEGNSTSTHGVTINPYPTQGIVPLLIFASNIHSICDKKILKNHYTHFQIFPTIEYFMGYKDINNTLFDTKTKINQTFFSGDLFGRAKTDKTNIKKLIKRFSNE